MNACFRKHYNTVNHCKMYTVRYFNVLIFFACQRYKFVMLDTAKFHSECFVCILITPCSFVCYKKENTVVWFLLKTVTVF